MKIEFTKMEGCGNDYVYVDCVGGPEFKGDKSKLARKISDRHFGVGSDGLIFINKSPYADFEMEMYNADGSRGEMCGNGMRCVAKLIYDRGYVKDKRFRVESMGSIKNIEVFAKEGKADLITVDMGEPILEPRLIPITEQDTEGPAISVPITAGDIRTKITCVSMGNPHGVVFLDTMNLYSEDLRTLPIEKIGPAFENHEMFPKRTNTEFVEVIDKENVSMRVWERGSGETLACGTGCCATAVACVLNGRTDRDITVHLLGGDLKIRWDESDNHIYMTGPARTVFEGTYEF